MIQRTFIEAQPLRLAEPKKPIERRLERVVAERKRQLGRYAEISLNDLEAVWAERRAWKKLCKRGDGLMQALYPVIYRRFHERNKPVIYLGRAGA